MVRIKFYKAIIIFLLLVKLEYLESSKLLKLAALAMILRSGGLHPYPVKSKHKEYHCDKGHDKHWEGDHDKDWDDDKHYPAPDKDWDKFNGDDDWKEPQWGGEHEDSVENRPHKTYVKPDSNRRREKPTRPRPRPSRGKGRKRPEKPRRKPEDNSEKDKPVDDKANDQEETEDYGNETYDDQQPVIQEPYDEKKPVVRKPLKGYDEPSPEAYTENDGWQDIPEGFPPININGPQYFY